MRGRNNNNRKGPNPLSRSYESNGPDVKIRGTAAHIADKYVQLARDATSSGDPISAENYLQHAEHYYRIVAAAQPQYPQNQGGGFVRADDESRDEDGDEEGDGQANGYEGDQQPRQQQGYPQNAPQPYAQNGEGGQPREQREPREQRSYNNHQNNGGEPGGLPAFITGGQEYQGGQGGGGQERGEGGYNNGGRNRNRNRRFGRYGRNGGPGEQGAGEGGGPSAEPEIAPGE
ncbi:hypothetical protein IZ6_04700 [Terrihabitans soli]|uniref:DUF4167 domain-containing protein n=1 Tax=Terrihabitans soli TaxID=708113 RepID=A0A6S6QPN1_9HYPH|nr:hypothetical protein IZ6_04700 [Terrihabitans soli]